jgi:hypothetical protein
VGRPRLAQDQKNARRRKAAICFFDESGVSLTPIVRSTWAPRGKTPVLVHHFNWKRASIAAALCFGSTGGGCRLAFHVQPGSYNTERLIAVLGELRRFLGGQKATLLWDGLPAHRSNLMKAWIASQRDWLVVERLPGYAPELNPTEALWGNLKGKGGALPTLPATPSRRSSGPPRRESTGFVAPPICRIRFFVTPDSTCGNNCHPIRQSSLG